MLVMKSFDAENPLDLSPEQLARVTTTMSLVRLRGMTLGQAARLLLNSLPPGVLERFTDEQLGEYFSELWRRAAERG